MGRVHGVAVRQGVGARGAWLALPAVLGAFGWSISATPADAIIGGQLTGAAYSNVGFLSIHSGANVWWCSGTLIAPTVVVTAAHCAGGDFPVDRVEVSFAAHVDNGPTFELLDPSVDGTASFDPRYLQPTKQGGTKGFITKSSFDLGIVVLDRPAPEVFPGIVPAPLPTVALVDTIAGSANGKRDNPFTSVGYGLTRAPNSNPNATIFTGDRRMATPPVDHLEPALLFLKGNVNAAWGDGGTCFGDSGGPVFAGTGPVIVAVFSFMQDPCHNLQGNVRLDTSSARSFLQQYVPLP